MKINYIVELILPAMTASLGTIGKDIDTTLKRDSEGFPFFSAKHIKGILRTRAYQFKRALGVEEKETNSFLKKYFGEEGNYLEKNKFNQIRFSNLKLILENKDNLQTGSRYGIRINRKTKTTLPQSLFSYEFLIANNKFEGNLEFNNNICDNKDELRFILACLFHLDRIGGMKSRGIGKVKIKIKLNNEEFGIKKLDFIVDKLIEINDFKTLNSKNLSISKDLEKYSYTLKLEEPIILKEKELGNYIKSRNFIQGSTIRGAIIEHFNRKDFSLDILKNIETSNALKLSEKLEKEEIKLASLFETKYSLKNGKKKLVDKVVETDGEVVDIEDNKNEIKLERASLSSLEISGNEISIKINEKLNSIENGMLFNFEYINDINIKENKDGTQEKIINQFEGDLKIPKNLLKVGDEFTIYLGKYRSKGFGKATISIKKYKEDIINKENIKERIDNLTKKVRNNMLEKLKDDEEKQTDKKRKNIEDELKNIDKYVISFDLLSDLVIPFSEVYDTGEQFLILANLKNKKLVFNSRRSFINIAKLEGYNIINGVRKVDELIFSKGSVFTYNIDDYNELLNELVKIEQDGLGLKKTEGFGRIKICSPRRDAR
ncbi:hypothetical protein CA839_11895 [Fusobacterium polymorphum]|uniref:CRISPR type III-associated protein domain-containing protein n=1 Tax=Fusobacterium nucleatum subsp. polymorphum TaxID=76857 RepID=A0A246EIQ2_FUSNP|nr:RAMP superfamily CRISPR-associated protein [Fusobacterium polymorphum]OWP26494.1 hypothetical protein CA839_11895 [Fusobacterium polymorphum]